MENALGVRFSRVAVVGDGGLLTVSYVVLDAERAPGSSPTHPPAGAAQRGARRRDAAGVHHASRGHNLRAGQTYYLVYENTAGALRADEQVTIEDGALRLRHVPVL